MKNQILAKYIHIFYGHDLKFSGPLIEAFNDPESGINTSDHLFVLLYKNLYEKMSHYRNVILDESRDNLLIKYGRRCKWLVSYGLPSNTQVLLTPPSIRKRIIYRYGGGSRTTHMNYESGKILNNAKVFCKRFLLKTSLNSFAAIGVSGIVDIIDLSNVAPNGNFIPVNYSYGPYGNNSKVAILEQIRTTIAPISKKEVYVMVGHRGTSENNHIEVLERLRQFNSQRIKIFVPLSYGNPKYIESVKQYIKDSQMSNVTIISNFMSYREYAELLYTMDIGIFDGFTSYALDNIGIFLHFRKTLYLRSAGVIAQAFTSEKIPFKPIERLGEESTEEFIQPVEYFENGSVFLNRDPYLTKRRWDKLFELYS